MGFAALAPRSPRTAGVAFHGARFFAFCSSSFRLTASRAALHGCASGRCATFYVPVSGGLAPLGWLPHERLTLFCPLPRDRCAALGLLPRDRLATFCPLPDRRFAVFCPLPRDRCAAIGLLAGDRFALFYPLPRDRLAAFRFASCY